MESPFSYSIDGKQFVTRLDFIEYCESQANSRELFNAGEFRYHNFPEKINVKEKIDPVKATSNWVGKLKQQGKPIVLMFGGGLDSTVALDFMMQANCPPDYLLTYTANPFDIDDFLCPMDMEPRYSLRYSREILENNKVLKKHTKLWHIHLDKTYAEEWFNKDEWLRVLTMGHSIESGNRWKSLPLLSAREKEEYTFIKGGNFPKVRQVDGRVEFYLVDIALGSILDAPVKRTYDFILDNTEMLKHMACEYHASFSKRLREGVDTRSLENMYDCHVDHTDKRYLNHFSKFIATQPPQLDKRFDSLVPYSEDVEKQPNIPYYAYQNRTPQKAWFTFLMAEWLQPSWYQDYKKTFQENEEWIKRINSYPGKLTKPIVLEE
jgi:hypothetical protein